MTFDTSRRFGAANGRALTWWVIQTFAADGTYASPGSLTISKSTFVALYVDVRRSLHDNGWRRAFLYSGHLATRHVEAVVQVVEEGNRRIDGMIVYATIDSEMLSA